jgi:hypothetical protein
LFLGSPLQRQVFVVISEWSRWPDGSDGPEVIDLGRDQEKDQEIGELSHLGSHPFVRMTTPYQLTNRMALVNVSKRPVADGARPARG